MPTQLLGFADGDMERGFCTMYDMKILNKNLISKIEVTYGDGLAGVEVTQASLV